MQQSLATWKNQATISSFRPTSLLNILPQGDEEQLRAQHQDILKKISMLQTMVRMAASEHDREATRNQVQTPERSISPDLIFDSIDVMASQKPLARTTSIC
jgi:hypothetical protein